jgi:hypothetical protein
MNIEPAANQPVADPQHVTHLQMTISIRSLSLAIIALLAGLFVLHWARAVFIPFMLGLVLATLCRLSLTGWRLAACHAPSVQAS